jgi:hypothetical protein
MGSATTVRIMNLALSKIGAKRITTTSDDTESARAMAAVWTEILDEVLMEHQWTFAQKRVALAELGTDPVFDDDGMSYIFAIPTDCLKPNFFNIPAARVRVEYNGIYSDTEGLKMIYTFRQTDPTKYSTMFVTALATRLAAELSFQLTDSVTAGERLLNEYEKIRLPRAIAADSQQGSALAPAQDEWVGARISGGASQIAGLTGWETWYPIG